MYLHSHLILIIKYVVKLSKFFLLGSFFLSNDAYLHCIRIYCCVLYSQRVNLILTIIYKLSKLLDLFFFERYFRCCFKRNISWMWSRCCIRIFFGMYIRKNNLILTIKYVVKLNKFFPLGSFFLSNNAYLHRIQIYCCMLYSQKVNLILTIKYV